MVLLRGLLRLVYDVRDSVRDSLGEKGAACVAISEEMKPQMLLADRSKAPSHGRDHLQRRLTNHHRKPPSSQAPPSGEPPIWPASPGPWR